MCRFLLAVIMLLNILLWMKILNSNFLSVASVLYLSGSENVQIHLILEPINSPEFLDILFASDAFWNCKSDGFLIHT